MPESKNIDQLLKSGVLKKGSDPSLIVNKLPIGVPVIDGILGGGMPKGRCIVSYGPESTGKTILAQYMIAASQKSNRPLALYMDMERSYDRGWWQQSGVDTDNLLVSTPITAEQAIDIMRAMLENSEDLGIIVLDSIAAMTPEPEMDPEKSSGEKTIGLQARVVTLMYRQIVPLLKNEVIFVATNQMRESIGMHDILSALPGGRAQRHYSHIILSTRRDSWIKDNDKKNIGFYMEITSRKNKVANVPDGTSITLPFLFNNQIDMLTSYIEEGVRRRFITRTGPYYVVSDTQKFLGMQNLRQFYLDNQNELDLLTATLTTEE